MSIPVTIHHTGVATAQALSFGMFGSGPIDTSFTATYASQCENQMDVVGASGSNPPVVLQLGSVAKVRVLIVKCLGNAATLLLTSARGATQMVPLSGGGLVILHLPTLGDDLTEVAVAGDGSTISYYVAGDLD